MQSHTKENESYRNGPWCRYGADPDIQWYASPQGYGAGQIHDILDTHTVSKDDITVTNDITFTTLKLYFELQKALKELQKTTSRILKQQGPVRQVHIIVTYS